VILNADLNLSDKGRIKAEITFQFLLNFDASTSLTVHKTPSTERINAYRTNFSGLHFNIIHPCRLSPAPHIWSLHTWISDQSNLCTLNFPTDAKFPFSGIDMGHPLSCWRRPEIFMETEISVSRLLMAVLSGVNPFHLISVRLTLILSYNLCPCQILRMMF
jgi:hypothetical protein